ncbi:hypothetical protein K439DRAFT_1648654 [Ramaria rubella]|nr:hypothetical protein K439DRAFT_1648654 [Ramaria rubella]
MGSHNHNPTGKNQHHNCPSLNSPELQTLLHDYDRRGITNKNTISEVLKLNYGISISPASITRCQAKMGLKASKHTTQEMPDVEQRQLHISHNVGVHLTREFVEMEMHLQDPKGFAILNCVALEVLGPHYEWSADGHDKLRVWDVWSGSWLGLWVVTNNRIGFAVAYLYLSLVEELGGMGIQSTTDCGSETTVLYELPAHQFLASIHNMTIERGWLHLRLQWGDNVKVMWYKGTEQYNYNSNDNRQYDIMQWLWPKLIQHELYGLQYHFNNHYVQKDHKKKNPSGVTPHLAMMLPHKYHGTNCLQNVDLKEELGGEALIHFTSVEYATHSQAVFNSLNTPLC